MKKVLTGYLLQASLLLLLKPAVGAAVVPTLNATVPGDDAISALVMDQIVGLQDIKCRAPPEGTRAINVDGEKDEFGITVRLSPLYFSDHFLPPALTQNS